MIQYFKTIYKKTCQVFILEHSVLNTMYKRILKFQIPKQNILTSLLLILCGLRGLSSLSTSTSARRNMLYIVSPVTCQIYKKGLKALAYNLIILQNARQLLCKEF